MKEKYENYIKKIQQIFARKSLYHSARTIAQDWKSVITTASIAGVVFSAVGVYVFINFNKEEQNENSAQSTYVDINISELKGLVRDCQAKDDRFAEYRKAIPFTPNPGALPTQEVEGEEGTSPEVSEVVDGETLEDAPEEAQL